MKMNHTIKRWLEFNYKHLDIGSLSRRTGISRYNLKRLIAGTFILNEFQAEEFLKVIEQFSLSYLENKPVEVEKPKNDLFIHYDDDEI